MNTLLLLGLLGAVLYLGWKHKLSILHQTTLAINATVQRISNGIGVGCNIETQGKIDVMGLPHKDETTKLLKARESTPLLQTKGGNQDGD